MTTQDIDQIVDNLPPTRPIGPMTEAWLGSNLVSQDLKDQWIQNGFSIIRRAYGANEIAKYNDIVAAARRDIDDGKDEHGLGDRIGQLHQKYPDLLQLASNRKVLDFLQGAFADDPIVFGSLNFERGSQQDPHIDAIFFWPEPSYTMCGCWIALEDIHPDAGPLYYVPESHSWPFFRSEDVVKTRPELAAVRQAARDPAFPAGQRAQHVAELGAAWTEDFRSMMREKESEQIPLSLKAGDAVFWHSLLAHGGSIRVNPSLSRKSVVFHYIGKNTKLYTFEQFMLYNEEELSLQTEQPKDIANYEGKIEYMRYPFFATYTKKGRKSTILKRHKFR